MTITEANAVNVTIRALADAARDADWDDVPEALVAAVEVLAAKANKVLGAGFTADQAAAALTREAVQ